LGKEAGIGKSSEQAMLAGAMQGYRGLVPELIAAKLPEIEAVEPNLTLEGLRLVWEANQK